MMIQPTLKRLRKIRSFYFTTCQDTLIIFLQEIILTKGKKFLITGIGINITKHPNIKNYPATNLQDVAKKSISKLKVENKLKHIFEKNLLKL